MTRHGILIGTWIAAIGAAAGFPGVATAAETTWCSPPAAANGKIVAAVAMAENEDPSIAGKEAAESLVKAMGGTPPRLVIVSECFEDKASKEKAMAAVCTVLPKQIVLGGATYGSFVQRGCSDAVSVCLLGLGGDGLGVSAALVTNLGTAKLTFQEQQAKIEELLHAAGAKLAGALRRGDRDRLAILIADAHSPKNQALVEGVQQVLGKPFPITGGCANKNAGQTFVYFAGQIYEDSAVAVMLSGDFQVGLSGRQAKDNEKVISTAGESGAEALAAAKGTPLLALAYNCAGRRSKLKKFEDELAAIQNAVGKQLPLFGCYCAGEMGPLDTPDKKPDVLSGGSGWHIMFTVISR